MAVTFVPADFRVIYPEFATLLDPALNNLFAEANLYLDNTDGSVVENEVVRGALFNLLVAHLAMLQYGTSSQPASQLVGNITNVSEGSVSIGVNNPAATANSAWYMQTKYGASYWQATAPFRSMRYVGGRSYPQTRRQQW